jgi:hypothetical protein
MGDAPFISALPEDPRAWAGRSFFANILDPVAGESDDMRRGRNYLRRQLAGTGMMGDVASEMLLPVAIRMLNATDQLRLDLIAGLEKGMVYLPCVIVDRSGPRPVLAIEGVGYAKNTLQLDALLRQIAYARRCAWNVEPEEY